MSTEQNKALARKHTDLMNAKDIDGALALCSSNFGDHGLPPGTPAGVESTRQFFKAQFVAFPDVHVTLLDMIAEGDKVVYRAVIEGTHEGPLMGVPPTGKHLKWTFIDINRIADGKIVENWVEVDQLGMMQQLGLVPPTQPVR